MFTPSQNPLLMMNRMNFGGQTGNQDIQPLAPDAAYQAGMRLMLLLPISVAMK